MSRQLYVDPGEEAGWCVGSGDKLLGGGQTKLFQLAHDFYDALHEGKGPLAEGASGLLRSGVEPFENEGEFDLVVIETFALYPWKAKELAWDEFRTVQLIGALQFVAQLYDIPVHKQAAKIKERAKAGGVEELFIRPLVENRHQNDAIMHFWFYRQVEVHGNNLKA